MKVLLVGGGGREHALAWKIAQSPQLTRLVCAPGNPGIETLCECRPVKADDVEGLAALAVEMAADLVVVGPEVALAAGLADRLAACGIACFGPSAAAARIESSKAFAKAFAARHRLPTAAFTTFPDATSAKRGLARFRPPYVVKADGLAAGKGVVIAPTREQAEAAIDALAADGPVVIEEFMEGEEASLFALCDGETAVFFGAAQDHKRAFDGDQGPNTGGMGAYSPARALTPALQAQAWAELIAPTVQGLAAEGTPFRGVLYAGLMLTEEGPKLVEFNARFGDPECQVLMLRLQGDLLVWLHASATGTLDAAPAPVFRDEAALCVVLAADGYPRDPQRGSVIAGADADFGQEASVFHAGTGRNAAGELVAAGGRVLNVCALGAGLGEARALAYAAVAEIDWPGGFHRTDIGRRGV